MLSELASYQDILKYGTVEQRYAAFEKLLTEFEELDKQLLDFSDKHNTALYRLKNNLARADDLIHEILYKVSRPLDEIKDARARLSSK